MEQSIFECQPGIFCRPTGAACYDEPYSYVGLDRASGMHIFEQGGKRELFRRTRSAPCCWHIKRGAYCFEFIRSI